MTPYFVHFARRVKINEAGTLKLVNSIIYSLLYLYSCTTCVNYYLITMYLESSWRLSIVISLLSYTS